MCGEKNGLMSKADKTKGSPPRVRGKGSPCWTTAAGCRITPACAGKRAMYRKNTSHERDHPRVCGEKTRTIGYNCPLEGSPPRVRGKAPTAASACPPLRITPACAGKSRCAKRPRDWRGGSPPRVRGKAFQHPACGLYSGITPACAGKSVRDTGFRRPGRDHPRVCGEKSPHNFTTVTARGSPPRVRGKDLPCRNRLTNSRITPACAGKRLKKALKNKDF